MLFLYSSDIPHVGDKEKWIKWKILGKFTVLEANPSVFYVIE